MNRLNLKTHFKDQHNLGENLISRKEAQALDRIRTSHLEAPQEHSSKSNLDNSMQDELGSDESEFLENTTPMKKIDFDLPVFDQKVIKMLELDPNEDE